MSKYSGAETVASFAFILFVLSWIILRLIYYPFWILWSTRFILLCFQFTLFTFSLLYIVVLTCLLCVPKILVNKELMSLPIFIMSKKELMRYTLKVDAPLLLFKFKKFSSYIKIYIFLHAFLTKQKVLVLCFLTFIPSFVL